jgi:hypothetical protein
LSRPTVRKHCRSQCEPLYQRQKGSVRNFVCGAELSGKDPHHGAPQTTCYPGCPA